jgi:ankyrin repeat protein
VLEALEDAVHQKDSNGWTPLHEGARAGHLEVVKLLVEKGANVNEVTVYGETALYWAEKEHGREHGVVEFLKGLGAISLGPEL